MKSPKLLSLILSIIITTLVVFLGVSADWAGPVSEPPDGNVAAPINIGGNAQSKSGGLIVGAGLTAAQTALIVPAGNVVIGTLTPINSAPNGAGGNASVNDLYIRSIGKWASQLSVGPVAGPAAYCGGVAYDAENAYCQNDIIYNVGDWIPLDNDSSNQTGPAGNWSTLITKQVTFPVKTCKLKAQAGFNDGGFVAVFDGAARLALWEKNFTIENMEAGIGRFSVKDQNNQACGVSGFVDGGDYTQTFYTSTAPYVEGGVLKWCGYVAWRSSGSANTNEYTVSKAKGTTATVYSTHALGDSGDNHSYTLYGKYCN